MKEKYLELIAKQLKCEQWRVANVVSMLEDGNTVPFISRYRKEKTGGLDDAQIVEIQRCMEKFEALEKRKATVRKTIQEQGCLTEELSAKIEECSEASLLEDIYLPYRPKRRTRASVAREAGLGPLAEGMFSCKIQYPLQEASRYMNEKVPTEELVLAGARDIIAEMLNESAYVRGEVRGFLSHRNLVSSATKAATDNPDALNYRAYFKHNEGINRIPAHRMLAMLRGEREGFLTLKMDLNADRLQEKIYFRVFHKKHPGYVLSVQLRQAVRDALDRLIIPSVTNDLVAKAKDKADLDSIKVFGDNLRQLLLAAPLGPKRVMAVDPGFRNGCKIACIDENGGLLHYETIYPHPPQNEKVKSIVAVSKMMNEYGVEAIGIGNGTASRETKDFFSRIPMPDNCHIYLVSEDGASVYSASEVGREEFPDEDATVRGAVSIGRRLQDPLAELVKIDPKSLGVGQNQHEVDQ